MELYIFSFFLHCGSREVKCVTYDHPCLSLCGCSERYFIFYPPPQDFSLVSGGGLVVRERFFCVFKKNNNKQPNLERARKKGGGWLIFLSFFRFVGCWWCGGWFGWLLVVVVVLCVVCVCVCEPYTQYRIDTTIDEKFLKILNFLSTAEIRDEINIKSTSGSSSYN